ncbi:TPA: NUDIX domain-containing protein [Enterococcus faecalis]|nr:NUDIX domain-containing protein [Enterococcus faecalis]HBI1678235.1 NUDIX domain-containing protein [Enterococcus faecalis]HBI1678750.1 NUDIX domain-containing protein [Enterococcus faecalis]HBI1680993.1 NUDIX domain-containing protein [Enterococcus faecalis]HBI1684195.1 NUDIX domain-containing protein [Enterococcus faecalis]
MKRNFEVELTTLCMIRNQKNEILVQERQKKDWPGWTFPGGHVEKNEGMETAMVRELLEETGLVLKPQLVGVAGSLAELFPVFFGEKQFYFKNNTA